jgi:hypothetical protein
MALTKQDLEGIKGVVEEAVEEKVPGIIERTVEPYFQAIQKDFSNVYDRFDRIEALINNDYSKELKSLKIKLRSCATPS